MRVTAKQIVLEVLSAGIAPTSAVPVRLLARAGEVFGIAENSVRVALARLSAEDRVESPERGAYRLGPAARPMHERVVSWRELEGLVGPWDGAFIGVHTAALPRTDRARVRTRDQALSLWGFRALVPGLDVRPANLCVGVARVRERLRALGLESDAPVIELRELGEHDERARSLWDGAALGRIYRETTAMLEQSEERLPSQPDRDALRESFLLGREVIRVLVKDPLLPEPLVDAAARRRLVETMRQYDSRAQARWKRFLEGALDAN